MATSFADIPTTAAIDRLPKTASGMPVPYATLYVDGQGRDPSQIEKLTTGGSVMRCPCVLGVGRPRLGKACPHRQRKAMNNRLCVVCGRKIAPTSDVVFIGVTRHRYQRDRDEVWTSIEPPAHALCAAYSVLACPRLARAGDDQVLVAVCRNYVVWQRVVLTFTEDGSPVGPIAPLTQPVLAGCVDLYAAVLEEHRTRVTTSAEWLRTAAPIPYRGMSAAPIPQKSHG